MQTSEPVLWRQFTLREALCLGFCATFIIVARAAFRLHLHLTGHAMFFTMFFLILGRGCVPKLGAGTLVGLIAGILAALLGMGKEGPLVVLKFLLPGLVVDAGAACYPRLAASYIACMIIGLLGAATRFFALLAVEWLVGMAGELVLQHAIIASVMNMAFGALGALMVPPVVRKLAANRLIP